MALHTRAVLGTIPTAGGFRCARIRNAFGAQTCSRFARFGMRKFAVLPAVGIRSLRLAGSFFHPERSPLILRTKFLPGFDRIWKRTFGALPRTLLTPRSLRTFLTSLLGMTRSTRSEEHTSELQSR